MPYLFFNFQKYRSLLSQNCLLLEFKLALFISSELIKPLNSDQLMNKYILIFRGQEGVDTSDEALKERISLHINWIKKLGDQHIDSQRLEESGTHLIDHNTVVTDGAFIEAKEIILGFTIIAAKNLEEDVFLAKTCPLLNYFEIIVRPVIS